MWRGEKIIHNRCAVKKNLVNYKISLTWFFLCAILKPYFKKQAKGYSILSQKNYNERHPQIGDIYLMNFDGSNNVQRGVRPGLVFQNNLGNKHSPNLIALPLTSSIKKSNQPTHVLIPSARTGLAKDSMVLCENPECISKNKLGSYLTTIPDIYMSKIAVANLLATSAISFIDPDALMSVWQKATALNAIA